MDKSIRFENHWRERVMEIQFPEGYEISHLQHIQILKEAWTQNLKMWHFPYTCLLDCRALSIAPEFFSEFEKLISFFSKFFMKKIIGYADSNSLSFAKFPFKVFESYELAASQTGLARTLFQSNQGEKNSDIRSAIQIENDFNAHVMEIQFSSPVHFETEDDLNILKSKIQNILMMWHTPYSILFNLQNCTFSESAKQNFTKLDKFFRAFFCKKILGYSPIQDKEHYPFPTYRSRHQAAAQLEHQGLESGEVANCSSRR